MMFFILIFLLIALFVVLYFKIKSERLYREEIEKDRKKLMKQTGLNKQEIEEIYSFINQVLTPY